MHKKYNQSYTDTFPHFRSVLPVFVRIPFVIEQKIEDVSIFNFPIEIIQFKRTF
jgi:hypothetical protein